MHANRSIEDDVVLPARRFVPERGALLRNFDVVVLLLAAAPVLLLGVPALGFCIGAGGWLLQRVLQRADRVWVKRASEPTAALGRNIVESFGRIWLLAGAIVAAGVIGGRADGLTAAVTIFCAYSIAFVLRFLNEVPLGASTR
jgi:hypothetical protein